MAKFVLGGIVTNIAGSVGGTTLRRVPNGFSMYNKIKGASVSKLLQNARVPQIANIFQRWALLSDSERSGWNATALTVTFPDKFGVAKNLTGRQLFSKVNIQGLPANITVSDSAGFTTDVPEFTLVQAVVQNDLSDLIIDITGDIADTRLLVSIEISNKQIFQPTFKSRKVIANLTVSPPDSPSIISEVLENYPYYNAAMYAIVYIQAVNAFGILSPYQYAFVTIAP